MAVLDSQSQMLRNQLSPPVPSAGQSADLLWHLLDYAYQAEAYDANVILSAAYRNGASGGGGLVDAAWPGDIAPWTTPEPLGAPDSGQR